MLVLAWSCVHRFCALGASLPSPQSQDLFKSLWSGHSLSHQRYIKFSLCAKSSLLLSILYRDTHLKLIQVSNAYHAHLPGCCDRVEHTGLICTMWAARYTLQGHCEDDIRLYKLNGLGHRKCSINACWQLISTFYQLSHLPMLTWGQSVIAAVFLFSSQTVSHLLTSHPILRRSQIPGFCKVSPWWGGFWGDKKKSSKFGMGVGGRERRWEDLIFQLPKILLNLLVLGMDFSFAKSKVRSLTSWSLGLYQHPSSNSASSGGGQRGTQASLGHRT